VRSSRRRASGRVVAAVVATFACAAVAFAWASGPITERAPPRSDQFWAIQAKAAVRHCLEGSALLVLIELNAASDDRGLLAYALEYDAVCAERPQILAMAYRGACNTGDARVASAIAARLDASRTDAVPNWRGIPCPPLGVR
jgi:hypothetical protein